MSEMPTPSHRPTATPRSDWSDKVSSTANEMADRARELIKMGNARRFIVTHDGREVVNLNLTIASIAGAVIFLLNPPLALIGVVLALILGVRARIEGGD